MNSYSKIRHTVQIELTKIEDFHFLTSNNNSLKIYRFSVRTRNIPLDYKTRFIEINGRNVDMNFLNMCKIRFNLIK